MAHRGSRDWRQQHWGEPCKPRSKRITFTRHRIPLWIDMRIEEAVKILGEIFDKHNYRVRMEDTGAYNCRNQKGSNVASSHAWATAIDVNWSTNPYRKDRLQTDMPKEMVDEIVALRTIAGSPVFRWGGDWDGRPHTPHSNYDAMHFEIVATPQELSTGIVWDEEDDVALTDADIEKIARRTKELVLQGVPKATESGLLDDIEARDNHWVRLVKTLDEIKTMLKEIKDGN